MPSKSNAKGSGAKSQTKDVVTGGASQFSNTSSMPTSTETSHPPSQDSLRATEVLQQPNDAMTQARVDELSREGGVNKKKQKRRMKEAAKKAAVHNDSVGS